MYSKGKEKSMNYFHNGKKHSVFSNRYIGIITVIAICVVWQIVTVSENIPKVILPSPVAVVEMFLELCKKGYGTGQQTLFVHLMASLLRLMIAYILSIVIGIPLGLISGCNDKISAVIDLFVEFYRPIPPLAYYTLLVLWLGISETSKITLLFLAGFAPIYISCHSSVRKINNDLINTSLLLGANKSQTFFHVIIPSALPDIFTGARTALGVEYTTLVSAEMVAAKVGIGWMVLDASNWLKSDVVFVGVICMGLTGILLNKILLKIEHATVHWAGK